MCSVFECIFWLEGGVVGEKKNEFCVDVKIDVGGEWNDNDI